MQGPRAAAPSDDGGANFRPPLRELDVALGRILVGISPAEPRVLGPGICIDAHGYAKQRQRFDEGRHPSRRNAVRQQAIDAARDRLTSNPLEIRWRQKLAEGTRCEG